MPTNTRLKHFLGTFLALLALLLASYLAARLLARPAPQQAWFEPRPGENDPLVFAHQGGENL